MNLQIFSKDVIAIGSSDKSLSPLTSNLKQFPTKEDWVIDKWDLNYAKKIEAFLADPIISNRFNWLLILKPIMFLMVSLAYVQYFSM